MSDTLMPKPDFLSTSEKEMTTQAIGGGGCHAQQ
jgi:hypothetical protein